MEGPGNKAKLRVYALHDHTYTIPRISQWPIIIIVLYYLQVCDETSRFQLRCVVKIHTCCKKLVKSKAFNIIMSELNYRNWSQAVSILIVNNLPNRSDCVGEPMFPRHLHHCHFRYTCMLTIIIIDCYEQGTVIENLSDINSGTLKKLCIWGWTCGWYVGMHIDSCSQSHAGMAQDRYEKLSKIRPVSYVFISSKQYIQ